MSEKIMGYCPMGCGATLFLGSGGYVTCSLIGCPRPDAAADLLLDRETEHLVEFEASGFKIKHPLKERLDDAILSCVLHERIVRMDGPPVSPGTYRATPLAESTWHWEPVAVSLSMDRRSDDLD